MQEQSQGLGRSIGRWWRKKAVAEAPELPGMWAYWELTDAIMREAARPREAEDQKNNKRKAA